MSDPRWPEGGGAREKTLLTHRQPGLSAENDFRIVQTETNRRREFEAEAAAPERAPVAPGVPEEVFFPPPRPQDIIDRLHKFGLLYVAVSNDHFPGDDPIPNPGYRTAGAAFSSINDAYEFARTKLAPKCKPGQRIIIWVIGGYYEEDIEIVGTAGGDGLTNIIDFKGFGQPITRGEWRIDTTCDRVWIDNFRMLQTTADQRMLFIEERVDAPRTRFPGVQLTNLHLYGSERGAEMMRRVRCASSIFEQASDDNGDRFKPFLTLRYPPSWRQWSVFTDCDFLGKATSNKRQKGHAIRVTSKVDDAMPATETAFVKDWQAHNCGILLVDSRINGFVSNECWRVEHKGCKILGGGPYPPSAANTYMYQYSISGPLGGVPSQTMFDDCVINSTFIAQCQDLAPHSNGITSVYINDVTHKGLFPEIPTSSVFDIAPNASQVFAVDSSTSHTDFHLAPVVSQGNTLLVPPAATEDFYFDEL